jgi:NADPH2:quinone reductase
VRAAVCRVHGGPDAVVVDQVPEPEVSPGQVRVAVAAAAVNYPDVLLVADAYQVHVPTPFVPGSELVGTVEAVAPDVTSVAIGDRVLATTMVGAFADKAVVSAASCTPAPPGVPDAVAAAFGVAHRTAYHALTTVAALAPGEELVVLGAGGGVGLAAVQLASAIGASVTAVASSADKLAAARAAGAHRLVNRSAEEDLRQALRQALPEGADVVVDPVGGAAAEPALRSLRFDGRYVVVGFASGTIPRLPLNLVLLKGVHVTGFQLRDLATHRPEAMRQGERELLDLLASGRVVPHVGARYPLAQVADALRLVADGQAIGKVVIDIA